MERAHITTRRPDCHCRLLSAERTAGVHTVNAGRRFYRCHYLPATKCDFFQWADDVPAARSDEFSSPGLGAPPSGHSDSFQSLPPQRQEMFVSTAQPEPAACVPQQWSGYAAMRGSGPPLPFVNQTPQSSGPATPQNADFADPTFRIEETPPRGQKRTHECVDSDDEQQTIACLGEPTVARMRAHTDGAAIVDALAHLRGKRRDFLRIAFHVGLLVSDATRRGRLS